MWLPLLIHRPPPTALWPLPTPPLPTVAAAVYTILVTALGSHLWLAQWWPVVVVSQILNTHSYVDSHMIQEYRVDGCPELIPLWVVMDRQTTVPPPQQESRCFLHFHVNLEDFPRCILHCSCRLHYCTAALVRTHNLSISHCACHCTAHHGWMLPAALRLVPLCWELQCLYRTVFCFTDTEWFNYRKQTPLVFPHRSSALKY